MRYYLILALLIFAAPANAVVKATVTPTVSATVTPTRTPTPDPKAPVIRYFQVPASGFRLSPSCPLDGVNVIISYAPDGSSAYFSLFGGSPAAVSKLATTYPEITPAKFVSLIGAPGALR